MIARPPPLADRADARVEGTARGSRWRRAPPGWWPPLELLVGPALVVVVLQVITTHEALFPHQVDLLLYFEKAEAFARGELPYRDFDFEYPPLALVSMVVPYVAWPWGPPDFNAYRWLFTAWQALLLLGLALATARLAALIVGDHGGDEMRGAVRRAGIRLLILAIVMAPSLAFRFDLLPALVTALVLIAFIRGLAGRAGALVGIGGLVKVYPLVLAPVLAAAWFAVGRSRPVAFAAAIGVTVSLFVLPLTLLAGDATWIFITYHADRGLQLESVAAGFTMLGAVLRGGRAPINYEFRGVEIGGAAADAQVAIQAWLLVIGPLVVALVALVAAQRDRDRLGAIQPTTAVSMAAAAVLVFIVTNKVISVQYVVWLLPMAVLLPRGQFWTAVAIAALSVLIHPAFYSHLIDQELWIVAVLCLRNVLLLVLLGWIMFQLLRPRPASSARDHAVPPD
jgi:hypothetical protein